jgi:TM2 domain-containing membrane protein YozV
MSWKTKVAYTFMIFLALTILFIGSLGLGLLTSHWLGYNVETGCSLDNPPMVPVNITKCETGAYKCVISDNYHLFAICSVYGTPVYMIVIIIGLIFCVKQRCCVEDDQDYGYQTPYDQVISSRYDSRY